MTPSLLHPARLGEVALLVLFFLVYLATLDTGFQPYELHGGDLITHQYAQVQARPSNAPGYPLYTMGGWLWFHTGRTLLQLVRPLPNPIPLLSSYSTVWALLALWLLYRILRRLTQKPQQPAGNWPVAWLIAAFFGVTYFFWYYATTTEQYSSAVAQTLAIVYLYLLWRATPTRLSLLFLLAFLSGLSLAHMLTVAFIVPPLIAVMLWQAPWLLRQPRAIGGAVLAGLAPLASYLYVYVRGAMHPEWWGRGTWTSAGEWFWAFVSTAQGREELGWGFEPGRSFFGNGFPQLVWDELSLPLLILSLIGIWLLDRRLRVLLYATLAIYLTFCWAYRFGNWFQVVLPAYPLVLMGLAPLADRIQTGASAFSLGWPRRLLRAVPLLILTAALIWRVDASLPGADSRQRPEDTALHRAATLIAVRLPAHAGLFAAVDDALALTYLTRVWGIRPDLEVVSSPQGATYLADGRPLLATWDAAPTLLAELPEDMPTTLQSLGAAWVLFSPAAAPALASLALDDPPPQNRIDREIRPGLTLTAYRADPTPSGAPVSREPSSALDVVLYWRLSGGKWPSGIAVSVRPLSAGNFIPDGAGMIVQQDRVLPVHNLWAPPASVEANVDLMVADGYRLPLPNALSVDGLMVIVYESTDAGFRNLAELTLPLRAPT